MKKILCLCLIASLFLSFAFFLASCDDKNVSDNTETTNLNEENSALEIGNDTFDTTESNTEKKSIDIYIIAGQSNAL